jgi:hypothetical protein
MSFRKSPQLTPALLAAARNNAQHSTGPRSAAAKQNSKLNALKHGRRVRDENRCQSRPCGMALGEDQEQFQTLTGELMSAFGPGDVLWEKQIEDLAWLYWRRERLERAHEGPKRRALQALLRLRKESANLLTAPPRHDNGPAVGNMEEIVESDISPHDSQSVVMVEDLELNEQCRNLIENKGPRLDNRGASGNVTENKCTYAQNAGMSLKRKGVIGNAELHATTKWRSFARKRGGRAVTSDERQAGRQTTSFRGPGAPLTSICSDPCAHHDLCTQPWPRNPD